MHGRFRLCTVALGLLLAGTQQLPAQTTPPASGAKNPAAPEVSRPLSPLHAFLGIDPITGEFKSPSAQPPIAPPAKGASQTATTPGRPDETSRPAASANATPGQTLNNGETLQDLLNRVTEKGELPPGDTRIGDTTLDELRTRLTKAVDARDYQSLAAELRSVTGAGGGSELFPGAGYVQLATLALLVYPLWIAMAACFTAWRAARRDVRTDRDRKHAASQLRRRLTLACSVAATIGICWLAGEKEFWTNEPQKLGAALIAIAVLMLFSAGLRLLIRRSANDYARKTIEDLRCQHAALCEEVKELRKRLQGEGIPESV